MTTLVWLRADLRLNDNPALYAAHQRGLKTTHVVYIYDTHTEPHMGAASKWWLHHSLQAMVQQLDGRLNLYQGDPKVILPQLCKKLGVTDVFWNRDYTPAGKARDTHIKATLSEAGITVKSANGSLLQNPWDVRNKAGEPFKVFTPFWKNLQTLPMRATLAAQCPPLQYDKDSLSLTALNLLPKRAWAGGLADNWTPGEKGAEERFEHFLNTILHSYSNLRDRPGKDGTSRLSPHLRFGEISPIRIWHRTQQEMEKRPEITKAAEHFLSELAWREFSAHLLYENPTLRTEPLRKEFNHFPWRTDYTADLKKWQKGQTGLPIVDAGLRELWHTGYMHNRVRMIVASVLIKNMLIPWQEGEAWFWDTLVDADLANNSASWQWVAGCGADAAPYFRIFNPILQGAKFDPEGDYVRKWVPELAKLGAKDIHTPWEADKITLLGAGLTLGKTYPKPIVDLKTTRTRALEAFQSLKQAG